MVPPRQPACAKPRLRFGGGRPDRRAGRRAAGTARHAAVFAVVSRRDCLWEAGMLVWPALGHGTSGGTSAGGIVPLIVIAVVMGFFLVREGQKKWRGHEQGHDGSGQ